VPRRPRRSRLGDFRGVVLVPVRASPVPSVVRGPWLKSFFLYTKRRATVRVRSFRRLRSPLMADSSLWGKLVVTNWSIASNERPCAASYALTGGQEVCGRTCTSSIRLSQSATWVSNRHFVIQRDAEGVRILDISQYGTWLNGSMLQPHRWKTIEFNDEIEVRAMKEGQLAGSVKFRLELPTQPLSTAPTQPLSTAPTPLERSMSSEMGSPKRQRPGLRRETALPSRMAEGRPREAPLSPASAVMFAAMNAELRDVEAKAARGRL